MGMYGPDEDDVVEQGGAPLRLPRWARRPRWLPASGRRPSRGAAILGIAGLVVGLAAGYALGYRHPGQAVRPSRATAAGAVPSAVAGSAAPSDTAASTGGPGAYSSNLAVAGLSGLIQTGGACSVQHGRDLQLGVEVINLSGTPVTLGQVTPILPLGGLRPVSKQWAPCSAIRPSWQAAGGGTIVFVGVPSGEVGAVSAAGAVVLPPNGTAWFSATFRVLVACPSALPVHFSVSYQAVPFGRTATAQLPGFVDLGQAKYSGCKGSS
ncbi:MAG: hypothetical protein ABSB76_29780 [Streptosporangiaceae bacterium]|jgi:hypothetical protein